MADFSSSLDATDWRLLELLEQDGRATYRELAAAVHLSPAATAARVQTLEDRGIITGYRAEVNPAAIGRGTGAIVRLSSSNRTNSAIEVGAKIGHQHPAVTAVYSVLGDCDLIFRVNACTIAELDALVTDLGMYGTTMTTIIVSDLLEGAISRPCGTDPDL